MTDTGPVVVFSLGGTIALTGDGGLDSGGMPTQTAADLVAAVPALVGVGVEVRVRDFRQLPSSSLSITDALALSTAVEEEIVAGACGVVVTQGTDTIEEISYLLDLVHAGQAPVVVTGAMRTPSDAGADGPANLLAAVRVAASSEARGLGCVVVLADEIHAARHVRKLHTMSTGAFASPNAGPLGHLAEGRVRVQVRPVHRVTVRRLGGERPVRVALVTMVLGDDGELLRCVDHRFDGLVIAGFGGGNVGAAIVEVLGELTARIPVVLASRTGAGPVLNRTYGYPGSGQDLVRRGLIASGFLDPLKARLLLDLLLRTGADRGQITRIFAEAGA